MKTRRTKTTLLESSIQNLRNSMGSLSMDQFVLQTIESLMSIERNEFLDSCTEDKGNGSYTRAFQSLSKNGLVIKVPRTRSGDFSPDTLELLKINQQQIDDICLSLYKKGLSGADISHFINECFGEKASPSKISQLAKIFHQFRTAWQNAPLETHYKAVFGDVIFITVRVIIASFRGENALGAMVSSREFGIFFRRSRKRPRHLRITDLPKFPLFPRNSIFLHLEPLIFYFMHINSRPRECCWLQNDSS